MVVRGILGIEVLLFVCNGEYFLLVLWWCCDVVVMFFIYDLLLLFGWLYGCDLCWCVCLGELIGFVVVLYVCVSEV